MIRHLSANHDVFVASLVRTEQEAKEGEGLAQYCAHYDMGRVRNPVQVMRMITRLPTRTPSSMGFFYSPQIERRVREMLTVQHFDLIFVHCSSVAQYVEGVQDVPKILDFGDLDSQKWLDYSRYKPFPLSMGYRLEGVKLQREEKRLASRFDMCTATTRAEWQTLESYATGVPTDWFPNGVDSDYFAPSGEPYDPDTITFVGRMDYYPNQECMFDFCATTLPLLQDPAAGPQAPHRGCRPVSGRAAARKTRGRDRHRIGPGCAAVPAPFRADGRAAQHCAGHPEQDSRGDGDGRSGRHEPDRGRGRGRVGTGTLPRCVHAGRIRNCNQARRRGHGGAQAIGARRPGRECFRTTAGRDRCSASTVSSSAALPGRPGRAGDAQITTRKQQWISAFSVSATSARSRSPALRATGIASSAWT